MMKFTIRFYDEVNLHVRYDDMLNFSWYDDASLHVWDDNMLFSLSADDYMFYLSPM